MNKDFDVVIVGGSVAGSSLALGLAKKGIRIALIDKASFPRRKACGEGLSDVALKMLFALGVGEELLSLEHHPFFGYQAWVGNYHVDIAYRKPADGSAKGVGIQRYLLDELLIKHTRQLPNITTFFGEKVGKINNNNGSYSISLERQTINTNYLVLADGANSVLAPRLGVPCRRSKSPSWGISWVFEGEFSEPVDKVAIIIKNGYEIYCTPVSHNRVNVCFLARKRHITELSRPERAMPEIVNALDKVKFKGKPIDAPVHIGPIASTRRPSSHGNILLVGDACESLDPISGMGMTHALLTSELAGKALSAILCDSIPAPCALANLATQRKIAVRPYRGFTRLTGALLRGSRNHGRVLELLAKSSFPAQIRDVLNADLLDSKFPATMPAALLMIAGL